MRVIILTPEYPPLMWGGVGTHVQQLAVTLSQRGHEVHAFCFAPYRVPDAFDRGVSIHYVSPATITRATVPSFDAIYEVNDQCVTLLRQMFGSTSHQPHILHLHGWYGTWAALELKRQFGWPVVLTAHGVHRDHRIAGEEWSRQPELEQMFEKQHLAIQTADRIIAVSEFVRTELLEQYNLPDGRVEVIWNGLDPGSFQVNGTAAVDRSLIDLCLKRLKSEKLILFAGRVVVEKGVLGLLRAAAQMLSQRRDVFFVISGEILVPSYGKLITSFISNDELLKNHVIITGKLSRPSLPILYQQASLVVIPSLYEPFGYVALEAMAYRKPIIASNVGGLPEIVEHNRTGILVPVEKSSDGYVDIDSAAWSDAMIRIWDDPVFARRIGENGYTKLITTFTAKHMAENVEHLYLDAWGGA
jgi:starch synthase